MLDLDDDSVYTQPSATGEQAIDAEDFALRNLVSTSDDTKTRVSANIINKGASPLILNKVRLEVQKGGGLCTLGPEGYGYTLDANLALSDGELADSRVLANSGPLQGMPVAVTGTLVVDGCKRLAVLDAAFPVSISLQPRQATWLTIDIPDPLRVHSVDGAPVADGNVEVGFEVVDNSHAVASTSVAVRFDGSPVTACVFRVGTRFNDPADAATKQKFCDDW